MRVYVCDIAALFLPDINNEKAETFNKTYKSNFARLEHLALVRAKHDTMVYPKDSEWFGSYEDGNWNVVLPMNATSWYIQDSFGLKTLDAANKITYYETDGDHLQFNTTSMLHWIDVHFKAHSGSSDALADI